MPGIVHVRRRGARYEVRRRLHLRSVVSEPITISLATADPAVARMRATRLAAKWDHVRMTFDTAHSVPRGYLKASEVTAVMKRALDQELGLAIAGHDEPGVDVAKLKRTHRILQEASSIAATLQPDTTGWWRPVGPNRMSGRSA